MKIYIAAGLHTERHRAANAFLADRLEAEGHEVYLPQRDGGLYVDLLERGMTKAQAAMRVWRADSFAIFNSDLLIATLDQEMDAGTVFEIGYAAALPALDVVLRASPHLQINPMLQPFTRVDLRWSALLAAVDAITLRPVR